MTPYYADDSVTLHHGDCLDILRQLPDASVDAVVTDPPYGLSNTDPEHVVETLVRWINGDREYIPEGIGFMGKAWDAFVPPVAVWDECLRVLKPGGHVLAYAGSRTHDLMTLGIRLAGFEIRDSIAWLYGQGFPKSLDVSKALDKAAGVERKVVGSKLGLPGRSAGQRQTSGFGDRAQIENHGEDPAKRAARGIGRTASEGRTDLDITAPATPDAGRWQGWGTALKPAFEPIVVGRKPIAGTVAANVLTHGTGALNIDGCRVATDEDRSRPPRTPNAILGGGKGTNLTASESNPAGRWPANVVLDDTQAAELDRQSGERPGGAFPGVQGTQPDAANGTMGGGWSGDVAPARAMGDTGGASRFFPTFRYEAKAPTSERPRVGHVAHPTVKPLDLMRWLVRLVTPPGGVVLEPFAGSGTTAEACVLEGFRCIAIEREADYLPLIVSRLTKPLQLGLELGA